MTSPHSDPARVAAVRALPGPAGYMCGLTWDGQYLWHSDQDAGKLYAIDPGDGSVVRTFDCSWVRADLAYLDGRLCQVGGRPKRLVLIDPDSGAKVDEIAVKPSNGRLTGIETGPEGMWMCLRDPAVIQLRDLATMTVQRELPILGAPSGMTYAAGYIVYAEFEPGLMHAVDAETGTLLSTVEVEGHPTGMTWDGEHLWYCDFAARAFKSLRLQDVLAVSVP